MRDMKKVILFMVMVFSLALTSNAKDIASEKTEETAKTEVASYSLKGIVYDAKFDESLSGATITVDGKKYYSDLSGQFSISQLTKGKHLVTVNFVSYQPQTVEVDLDNTNELKIQMKQQ